jgi:elongation factor G
VFLKVEALERGSGFEFVDAVKGGVIPGQLVPAVEKGVRQGMEEGTVAGFPIQDVRVTVHDGKHHAVDSNEVSFVIAGRKAFLDGFAKASPVVLEPIVELVVTAPGSAIGDINGELSARRGRITHTEMLHSGATSITAQVPLAELGDFPSRLKSLTGGEGSYVMQLSQYEPAPGRVQAELARRFEQGRGSG